eukprot:153928-Lingulodinium_polyedra.AAC.1
MKFLRHSRYRVHVMVEHHLAAQELAAARAKLARDGKHLTACAARLTGRSQAGTAGGIMVVHGKHEAIAPRRPFHVDEHDESHGIAPHWLAVRWQLKGTALDIIGIYLKDSIGATGNNASVMLAIARYVREAAVPCIVIGDWNMDPEQAEEWGMLAQCRPARMEFLTIAGRTTCMQGGGTCDDYALIDQRLRHVVSLEPAEEGVWRPHIALRLRILARPRSCTIKVLRMPVRMDRLPNREDAAVRRPDWWGPKEEYTLATYNPEVGFMQELRKAPLLQGQLVEAVQLAQEAHSFGALLD